ncbi:Fur family transcriptional regulator [Acidiferrobacter sp.]|uniref:Fur family transcriptional regulator n=1 Tax=Acidiferrobacter sp. TaxID=1872107 RepID=UPI0026302040|nr:Fur family transcriptional regulator [Acidiferrobacter sp.]
MKGYQDHTSRDLADLLRTHGINPTVQRIEIARLLVYRRIHLTAEDVFRLVNRDGAHVSKATVYNTLGVFAEKGLIREVVIDPTRVVYDSNTSPHHHFYNTETGELFDIEERTMSVAGLPPLPQGTEVEGVEVIVRLRSSADRVA